MAPGLIECATDLLATVLPKYLVYSLVVEAVNESMQE